MPQRYTRIAMLLHWVVALLILANIALGWTAHLVAQSSLRPVIDLHKSIGITVLGLVLLRILWRLANPPPPMPRAYSRAERTGAHAAHLVLYALILAIPLSGWMHDSAWKAAASHPMYYFGLFQWPRIGPLMALDPASKDAAHSALGAAHEWLGFALYALLTLHIVGALKHQWLDREPELQRMWLGQ